MADRKRKTVMISSTTEDLCEHRKQVRDACLRLGMFPLMMEHLSARSADAVQISLRMVDEADLYLGIFAHRYGHVPRGHDRSITEIEYDRAVQRGIPRLIFVMGEDHPLKSRDVDTGEKAVKLAQFKERLLQEYVVGFFASPDDLRAQVMDSLVEVEERVPSEDKTSAAPPTAEPAPTRGMASTAVAPAPSPPPQGATARCRDGTFSLSRSRSGACSHHGGVKDWLA